MEAKRDKAAYFIATLEILEREGSENITINALCDRLAVTKGSFYHHFADLTDFVTEFAAYWETAFREVITRYHSVPERCQRIAAAINTTAALSHEAEAALRAWGPSEPVVQSALDRIDAFGEEVVLDAVRLFITDHEQAALIAHHGVSLAVGMQHRPKPIDPVRYLEVLAQWARLCLGVQAEVVVTPQGRRVRVWESVG